MPREFTFQEESTKSLSALLEKPLPRPKVLREKVQALLLEGADANTTLPNGQPLLHGFIEKDIFKTHKSTIHLLIENGADIHAVGANDHNATSLALETNHTQALAYLVAKGGTVPYVKLENGFLQAVSLMLSDELCQASDFANINEQNKQGLTALHVAVLLNHHEGVDKLIHCGANPLIKDNLERTPLKIAESNHYTEITKTLLNYYLDNHEEILKFSDFTLYQPKGNGESKGGFYHDKQGEAWLLKMGHDSSVEAIVKEDVAGALYQCLLGENAPQTAIVIDNFNGEFLTASKLIPDFKTLAAHASPTEQLAPWGAEFPASFENKPIAGFMDGICAIEFLCDTDAHDENVGLRDNGDLFSFIKIDHGFSFNFSEKVAPITLDTFRKHLAERYNITLEKVGFDAVYQSVNKISNLDFSVIENVVAKKINELKPRMELLDLSQLNEGFQQTNQGTLCDNLCKYQNHLLKNLAAQHEDFKNISKYMTLEKAIIDHDASALCGLFAEGINMSTPFKPFYAEVKPQYLDNSTTGNDLAQKHWPKLFEVDATPMYEPLEKPILLEDVLSDVTNGQPSFASTYLPSFSSLSHFFSDVGEALKPILMIPDF